MSIYFDVTDDGFQNYFKYHEKSRIKFSLANFFCSSTFYKIVFDLLAKIFLIVKKIKIFKKKKFPFFLNVAVIPQKMNRKRRLVLCTFPHLKRYSLILSVAMRRTKIKTIQLGWTETENKTFWVHETIVPCFLLASSTFYPILHFRTLISWQCKQFFQLHSQLFFCDCTLTFFVILFFIYCCFLLVKKREKEWIVKYMMTFKQKSVG